MADDQRYQYDSVHMTWMTYAFHAVGGKNRSADNVLHRFDGLEPDRTVLSPVSAADRQDERVAGRPTYESQHHRVLRLGGCVFLEQRRPVTDTRRAVLRRVVVCAKPDELHSARRAL